MLGLVSEIFSTMLEPLVSKSRAIEHHNLLAIFEWRVGELTDSEEYNNSLPGQMGLPSSLVLEIIKLTLLVYLERASGIHPSQSVKMSLRIQKAFTIFSQLEIWHRQLPLLILGCEARTDKDRMVIIDLISRTEQSIGGQSFGNLKSLIQSLWSQDDLAERELHYTDKIRAVLSSSNNLPLFV
jgi:hypothetical protein